MSASSRPKSLTPAVLRAWPLPNANDNDSKEDRGQVLVIGGSRQIPGAVLLAAEAALRAGAGKLQVASVSEVAVGLAIAIPEARVIPISADQAGNAREVNAELLEAIAAADAVVIGPGMTESDATSSFVGEVLTGVKGIVVLDAGALASRTSCKALAAQAILTPHAGEMAMLIGESAESIALHPADVARSVARDSTAVVVLKGPTTVIASPDGRLWVNRGGSVGLGTSGSGDVLAGLIAGLAARGAPAAQAAAWGVYLHARAGALLERRFGPLGLLAREISKEVPKLMGTLS